MKKQICLKMLALLSIIMVIGCAARHTRHPVPVDQIGKASLNGTPDRVRTYWDKDKNVDEAFQQDIIQSFRHEPPDYFPRREDGLTEYNGLAISGGGVYGAFGAGILYGWSESGRRPRFKIVTGISTGALIAPYAFLGSAYDEQLKTVYTTTSSKNIFKIKKLLPFGSQSLAESKPLKDLLAASVDENMLADIADAHGKGQRLYIGTTELDSQRFFIWNMGAIASIGNAKALSLFRDIILASASIPGVLPPVYIDVEVDGQIYDEMHVDGGVINQVFSYEFLLDVQEAAKMVYVGANSGSIGNLYLIRNGVVKAVPQSTKPKALSITKRSINTMIKSAAMNDLFRIYSFAQKDNVDFNFICVPSDYIGDAKEAVDPEEMKTLFDMGYQKAKRGHFWIKRPFVD